MDSGRIDMSLVDWRRLEACFSKSLSERGPSGFCSFPLCPSTNGRSVRLKASVHRFQAPILQVYIGHRIRFYAVSTHAHIHGLSNNNRDWLLALSAATAGKLVRDGRLAGVNPQKWESFRFHEWNTWKTREFRAAARTCSRSQTFWS